MVRGEERNQPMACDRHRFDFRALERAFYETEIDVVLQDPVALRGVRHIGQFEADIRVAMRNSRVMSGTSGCPVIIV
jgi:hypothetical protein